MYSKIPMPQSEWTKENMRYVMCFFPLIGVVIGEMIGSKRGLGYLIIYSSQVFKLDTMIMSIVILCIIAAVLYSLINVAEKKYRKHF